MKLIFFVASSSELKSSLSSNLFHAFSSQSDVMPESTFHSLGSKVDVLGDKFVVELLADLLIFVYRVSASLLHFSSTALRLRIILA